MTSIQKRALYLLVGSQLLIMLGIGLVIPVEPYIKTEMGLTAMDMGIMAALFAAVQFIASPIIGRLSDKFARIPIIAAGLLLCHLGSCFCHRYRPITLVSKFRPCARWFSRRLIDAIHYRVSR